MNDFLFRVRRSKLIKDGVFIKERRDKEAICLSENDGDTYIFLSPIVNRKRFLKIITLNEEA